MTTDPTVLVIQSPSRTEYVDRHVRITEERAPTDASVALLREMEAKARAEVLKSVVVGNTTFECAVHQMWDALSDKTHWRAVFKLNGKTLEARSESDWRTSKDNPQQAFQDLRDAVARVVAEEVLGEAFMRTLLERREMR